MHQIIPKCLQEYIEITNSLCIKIDYYVDTYPGCVCRDFDKYFIKQIHKFYNEIFLIAPA